jgi:hypothetical protein
MTDKPALVVFKEVFGDTLRSAQKPVPSPAPTLATEGDAHNKLQRNVDLALDVHKKAMDANLPDVPQGDKRLMVESAHATIKAALATDRTALRAHQDNIMELVMLRVLFARKLHGYAIKSDDEEKLRSAPRLKLEAALSARQLAEYDALKW